VPHLAESDRVFIAGILVGVFFGLWMLYVGIAAVKAYERYKRRR
jgi:hypothetical protein